MIPIIDYKVISDLPGIDVETRSSKLYMSPFKKIYNKHEPICVNKKNHLCSGIYVNIQDYFDTFYHKLFEEMPNIKSLTLVDKDGNDCNYNKMMEILFQKLKDDYSFTIGDEYKDEVIRNYQDLENIIPSKSIMIQDIKMRRGMYVEVHKFARELNGYKFRETYYKNDEYDNNTVK